ncbi:BspA family leucine-rich repeat surface protein [Marinicellulosiphila megalodicopiae]|uniref:BspA family leucine-rich repeat surface protein n=1 Tax=Marinicellulosiphila megalodicopiae TaxID=2724896 RepID=UPI003BB0B988
MFKHSLVITCALTFAACSDVNNLLSPDTTAPKIELVGPENIVLSQFETYIELGAHAVDDVDGQVNVVQSGAINSAEPGTYVVTYFATDAQGNQTKLTRTVTVLDTMAPILILNGQNNITLEFGESYIETGALVSDNYDENIEFTITGSVIDNQLGEYALVYQAVDASGNQAKELTRTVTVVDTLAPIITLKGESGVVLEAGTTYIEEGVTVFDTFDQQSLSVSYNEVDSNILGMQTVTYHATDSSGNIGQATRHITIEDTTTPSVTLFGKQTQNILVGSTYLEKGVSFEDLFDDSPEFTLTGSVNSLVVGDYALTYTVTDQSGNKSSVMRNVLVQDLTKPTISLIGPSTSLLRYGAAYVELGASVSDNYDSDLTAVITGEVNNDVLGTYTLTYNVSDSSGNVASEVTRNVIIVDTQSPEITLNGESFTRIFLGETYLELSATASDNYDNNEDIQQNLITTGTVNTQKEGTYYIRYQARDLSGNQASIIRTVEVIKDLAPEIVLNGDPIIYLYQGDTYEEQSANAMDARDGIVEITTTGEVDTQTIGKYSITYSATDSINQQSEITRTIFVLNTPFITTWKTDNPGSSNDNQITLEANLEDFPDGYRYIVNWGDGHVDVNVTGNITHTYSLAGTYQVSIAGDYPQIYFDGFGALSDSDKLLSVDQWGGNVWLSMTRAFIDADNLEINALDVPDLSLVSNMSFMFANTELFNQDIGGWDVSNVTNMSGMFNGAVAFNQDIGSWNVSNVTNMSSMFSGTVVFDQDIGNWDVSSVIDMSGMFSWTIAFDKDIGNWDVSSVIYMSSMFNGAVIFNQEIGEWDVSCVTEMNAMFSSSEAFNQNINNWNVSSVTQMNVMFSYSKAFQQPLDNWDMSSVTEMAYMFLYSTFNAAINNWDLSSVTSLNRMFLNAENFNQDLGNWNVSSVTDMESMFDGAMNFNKDINSWDTSSVITMKNMFFGAENFNQPLNNWDVSSVTSMYGMFSFATSFNKDLNEWDTFSVTDFGFMFRDASTFNGDVGSWDTSSATSLRGMFLWAPDFNQDLSNWGISSVTEMHGMFYGALLDTNYYDAMLIAWSSQIPQEGVTFSAGLSQYTRDSLAQTARTALIETYGWELTDGGPVVETP